MMQIRVLSAREISQVFTVTDALEAVEDAYRQKAEGEATAWPMVYEQFEPGVADMDIRSGELAGSGLFGLKLTAWFSGNPSRGLPEVFGTTLLCDDATGAPLALLNAGAITGLRTGAAAALGVKWLARKDASRLLVVGAGHMSTFMVAATLAACPSIGHVEVWDPRKEEAPVARVELMRGEVQAILEAAGAMREFELVAVADGKAAAGAADAIVTITPATDPCSSSTGCAPARTSARSAQTWRASRSLRPTLWPRPACSWTTARRASRPASSRCPSSRVPSRRSTSPRSWGRSSPARRRAARPRTR